MRRGTREPMQVVVLQHVECEPPGTYTPFLAKRGNLVTVRLDREGAAALDKIDLADTAAVVAMGGPMGVYQTRQHPWIARELEFIATSVDSGVPFLGICLGAQLLAAAFGGEVFPGAYPEVGVGRVDLLPAAVDDPVLGGLPPTFPVLQWHGDTFTLPPSSVLLASSDMYPNQAFRVGPAYGLQFHVEASWDLASEWLAIDEYRSSIEDALGRGGPDQLARELPAVEADVTAVADHIVESWLSSFVDPRMA